MNLKSKYYNPIYEIMLSTSSSFNISNDLVSHSFTIGSTSKLEFSCKKAYPCFEATIFKTWRAK